MSRDAGFVGVRSPPRRRGGGDGPRRRGRPLRRLHHHDRKGPRLAKAACAARASIWRASASPSNGTTARWSPRRSSIASSGLGYPAYPFASATVDSVEAVEEKRLLRCLGVAAFGAMNVMLISIALWSGAADAEGWATRDFFHWLSALVALPTVAYAGRPFFDSAMRALRQASFNMDVPITLGVMLALLLSVVQTLQPRARDLFRQRGDAAAVPARRALSRLSACGARRATSRPIWRRSRRKRRSSSSTAARRVETPIEAVAPGDLVLVRAGERVAVDGIVEDGRSEVDQSLVTGETAAGRSRAGRAGLRRHAEHVRRAARARQQRRDRHAARRSQRAARARRSSSARPMSGSPIAPRGSMRRSCI